MTSPFQIISLGIIICTLCLLINQFKEMVVLLFIFITFFSKRLEYFFILVVSNLKFLDALMFIAHSETKSKEEFFIAMVMLFLHFIFIPLVTDESDIAKSFNSQG